MVPKTLNNLNRLILIAVSFLLLVAVLGKIQYLLVADANPALQDAVTGLSLSYFTWIAIALELVVLTILASRLDILAKMATIAACGAVFCVYRGFHLASTGGLAPCPCMGRVPDSMGISTITTNRLLWLISILMFSGGVTLFGANMRLTVQRRQPNALKGE
jgi:hypothetical protein